MAVEQQTSGPPLDEARLEAFMGKAVGDLSGIMATALCALGDRLGLFKDLAEQGPSTAAELAQRTDVNERYALEWLRGMTAAGYLEYDRSADRFSLPPEHAPALADEGGPMFFGGAYQEVIGTLSVFGEVAKRFREGGGVPQESYPADFWDGLQRFTGGWFENMLIQLWVPAMPDLERKLAEGALCADVGCGAGRASIKLAQEFPNTRHVGYDVSDAQLERARQNAKEAGVEDRVRFEKLDVSKGMPEQYDVITTFDVVHDAVDPAGLLRAIREGLKDDGIYVCLDINCADDPADNEGPLATVFYGFSVFYCMTTSLAHGGAGLGTVGLPHAKLSDLCEQAGFGETRLLPLENPFNNVYEVRP
jgi:2-polyprenyl-3-methyl-5-hydroxy-6-metoxy-1,4-benzoquinol methylase